MRVKNIQVTWWTTIELKAQLDALKSSMLIEGEDNISQNNIIERAVTEYVARWYEEHK